MGVKSRIVGTCVMYNEEERDAFVQAGGDDDYVEKSFDPDKFIPIHHDLDNH